MIDGTYSFEVEVPFGRKTGSVTLRTEGDVAYADIDAPIIGKQHMEGQVEGDTFTAQGSKKIKLVVDSMMSFSYFPIKFMSGLGVVMAILSFIWILEVLIEYIAIGTPVRGWSTLMCLVLFSSGLILLMLGVLGEYLWRTLDATRNRPVFIVDTVVDSQKAEKE